MTLAPTLKMQTSSGACAIRLLQEGRDVVFLPCVQRAGKDPAALGLDVLHERCQPLAVAPSGENRKSLGGEFPGDRTADEITGTDDRDRSIPAFQLYFLRLRQWASAEGAGGAPTFRIKGTIAVAMAKQIAITRNASA